MSNHITRESSLANYPRSAHPLEGCTGYEGGPPQASMKRYAAAIGGLRWQAFFPLCTRPHSAIDESLEYFAPPTDLPHLSLPPPSTALLNSWLKCYSWEEELAVCNDSAAPWGTHNKVRTANLSGMITCVNSALLHMAIPEYWPAFKPFAGDVCWIFWSVSCWNTYLCPKTSLSVPASGSSSGLATICLYSPLSILTPQQASWASC